MFKRLLSRDCGPFWQFVKYGVVGVMATIVQMVVFYILAATCLKCLAADDWAVRYLSLPAAELSDAVRAVRFAVATAVGFTAANIFCWIMNRAFVFTPGKFRWYVEFGMFFGAAAFAMLLANAISALLIYFFGLMTSIATMIEVIVSFMVNYVARRRFIFRG